MDEVETLQILPPLVPAQDVRAFLVEALRAPIFDRKVVRDVNKARDEQVARRLMYLQSKRVKVTDSRMYVVSFRITSAERLLIMGSDVPNATNA